MKKEEIMANLILDNLESEEAIFVCRNLEEIEKIKSMIAVDVGNIRESSEMIYIYHDNHDGRLHATSDIKYVIRDIKVINFDLIDKLYISIMFNFNGHEWIAFYEDTLGCPRISFSSGCEYNSILEFEKNVKEKYGSMREKLNYEGISYRTYMLEAEKLRLALELPPRPQEVNLVKDIKDLLLKRKEVYLQYLREIKGDYYGPKNSFWFEIAENAEPEDFYYLEGDNSYVDMNRYYDLITVKHQVNNKSYNIAIPAPILSIALGVYEDDLFRLFTSTCKRDEIEWI